MPGFFFFFCEMYGIQVIHWSITDQETEISCNKQENSVTLENLQLDLELRFHM